MNPPDRRIRISCASAIGLVISLAGAIPVFAADMAPSSALVGPKTPPAIASFEKDILPFISQNCFKCHGNGKSKGKIALDSFHSDDDVQKNLKTWRKVIDMLGTDQMPPEEEPRPNPQQAAAALQAIERVLNNINCDGPIRVGRVTLRRLNRFEYLNTIRDLVGVEFDPTLDFPNDDVGYGFDNIGDVLTVSPLLLEKYLSAAEAILNQTIVIADPPKALKIALGGETVAPANAGGDAGQGAFYLGSTGRINVRSAFDEGDYIIRVRAATQPRGEALARAALYLDNQLLEEFDVSAERATPQTLEARVRIKAGPHTLALSLLNPFEDLSATNATDVPPPTAPRAGARAGLPPLPPTKRLLLTRGFEVEGPFNPPPVSFPARHQRIMNHASNLEPAVAAEEIVTRFAGRAFRRPPRPAEIERLMGLYRNAESQGERFENCVKQALCGILASPNFLFRVEVDPSDAHPGLAYMLNDYELACRLSYFLWSSMPDQELFDLAAAGQLRDQLAPQVQRMLADPKIAAFTRSFGDQWLTLGKLALISPDATLFPNFDEQLRADMIRETQLFFESMVREDRNIYELIDANYSFVNGRLASLYGLRGVQGEAFRKVTLPSERGGILTQASILTLTSNATRTSPVKRGKWITEQILGTTVPDPPPNVPTLSETTQSNGTFRQMMEEHRSNPQCASCHARFDPVGFGLENFSAIGAWRTMERGLPIDASGVLPDGRSFRGPTELKSVLRKDLFSRNLSEKVLTYALGRGLEYYDKCAVDKILEALAVEDNRFSAVIMAVVLSDPFRMRTAAGGISP